MDSMGSSHIIFVATLRRFSGLWSRCKREYASTSAFDVRRRRHTIHLRPDQHFCKLQPAILPSQHVCIRQPTGTYTE